MRKQNLARRNAALVVFATLGASCMDPVQSDAVDALGPEVSGVPEGPLHRAGQPCTTCHGGKSPVAPEWIAAGTIYAVRGGGTPAVGATVLLTDARGDRRSVVTNVVGNFYIPASDWSPAFPLHAEVQLGTDVVVMATPIGRNAGCGYCHQGTGDAEHMPAVYVREVAP